MTDLQLQLLSDDPIRDVGRDGLDLKHWAAVVANAALDSVGPLSIGVFGRWGVGKTSVLHLAKARIEQSPKAKKGKITVVMFNAWQYQNEEVPVIPLVAAILQGLERNKKIKDGIKVLSPVFRAALHGISMGLKGRVPMVGEMNMNLDAAKSFQRYEDLRSQWIDRQMEQSLYFNAFDALRNAQMKSDRHQIVVMIDDLDRCLPDKVIRLLESIKLVLSEPGIIFVLAADRRILETYIDKRFREEFGSEDYHHGQSYLAKFIQLPLWIPSHETRFEKFIERILEREELKPLRRDLKRLLSEVGLACACNPRQLIRFINDLLVDRYLFRTLNKSSTSNKRKKFPVRIFVVARGIQIQSEFVYRGLLRLPALCESIRDCSDEEALRQMMSEKISKLESHDIEAQVLLRLKANEYLPALLASKAGAEWLKGDDSQGKAPRRAVEDFLSTERQVDESSELNNWVLDQTRLALDQIHSVGQQEIISGCYTLTALDDSPLRKEAIPRLVELSKWDNERVAQAAAQALEKIR